MPDKDSLATVARSTPWNKGNWRGRSIPLTVIGEFGRPRDRFLHDIHIPSNWMAYGWSRS